MDGVLKRIYMIFGGITLFCFGSYFIKLIITPEGLLPFAAASIVVCAVVLPMVFDRKLRDLTGKAYLPLKACLCACFVFYTVTFASLVGYIYLSESEYPTENTGAVYVVFGAKINGDSPSLVLASRLDAAVQALEADPDGICIVSGGQGDDENMPEGECMREYLISRGIDESRIYAECEAVNTAENIRKSMKLLDEMGEEERRIVCISSDTHIPRIRLLCAREGVDADFIKAPTPARAYWFTNLVREYLSYARMLVIGY